MQALIPHELLPHQTQPFAWQSWFAALPQDRMVQQIPAEVTGWNCQGRKQPTFLLPIWGGKFYHHLKGTPKTLPMNRSRDSLFSNVSDMSPACPILSLLSTFLYGHHLFLRGGLSTLFCAKTFSNHIVQLFFSAGFS